MLRAPLLWPSSATPETEILGIKKLSAYLVGLEYSVEAWRAGLLLYNIAESPPASIPRAIARRWRFIACHECILELYHLRSRLEKIQSVQLRKCPSVRALVDSAGLRAARKRLDDYFPGIEALRHAIAHKGENEAYPDIHAPDGQYALMGFREPGRYSIPYRGSLYALDITDLSLQRISEVVAEFFAAFSAAANELEKQGHLD